MFQQKEAQGLRIMNTIFFVFMVAANAIFELMPLNNVTSADVSARYDTLLTPPGFAFAIWTVIYVWLFLFILYQFGIFHSRSEGDNPDIIHAIGAFFMISCAANIGWIFAWHNEYLFLQLILIIVLWISLLYIRYGLQKEVRSVKDNVFARMPFSIYLSWTTAAMALNLTIAVREYSHDYFGMTEEGWAIGFLAFLFVLAEYFLFRYHDYLYALTASWVLFGILFRYLTPTGDGNEHTTILLLTAVLLGVLLVSLLAAAMAGRNKSKFS